MLKEKHYYFYLDIVRIVSCIAILLYHLDILKGGYLAVCSFFVLSGYLSTISCFKNEKFSFIRYYKNKFLKIYLPLLVVVFLTILVIPYFKNINWINLKPETTSVLFGYNNYWQLNANLDYFAHHISSPFMHFWYIGILIQFDVVFPFIFVLYKKIGDRLHKMFPCLLLFLMSLCASFYFYYASYHHSQMMIYYDTFTRLFSLLYGVFLGFFHNYYGNMIPKFIKNKYTSMLIYDLYISLLIASFIVSTSSQNFVISMILVSLITVKLIDYGTLMVNDNLNLADKIIKKIAGMSYLIYLFQYPVIFISQYTKYNNNILFIIVVTFILSFIVYFILDIKNKKWRFVRIPLFIILISISLFGGYKYIMAKDYTKEMKELEEKLDYNEKIMNIKKEEYLSKQQKEQEEWQITLDNLKQDEEEINVFMSNMHIIGIGDSVMLSALDELYNRFPNGYFDAKISRTDYEANGILTWLKNNGMLGTPIVIALGTNGQCGSYCRDLVLNTCENRPIFFITVTNDYEVYVNDDLINYANNHENVFIIDWNNISKGHKEYFIADGIHLTGAGVKAYIDAIYDNLYQYYIKEYNDKKEAILLEHENELKTKITFFGNDLLLNDHIMNYYSDDMFILDKDFNYEKLVDEINKEIENKTITQRIVFVFDNSMNITSEQYEQIIELCHEHEIYIVSINNSYEFDKENVHIINFNVDNYLMFDKIHLTDEGNEELFKLIINNIEK